MMCLNFERHKNDLLASILVPMLPVSRCSPAGGDPASHSQESAGAPLQAGTQPVTAKSLYPAGRDPASHSQESTGVPLQAGTQPFTAKYLQVYPSWRGPSQSQPSVCRCTPAGADPASHSQVRTHFIPMLLCNFVKLINTQKTIFSELLSSLLLITSVKFQCKLTTVQFLI